MTASWMKLNRTLLASGLAVLTALWVAPGESSDPLLELRELPLEVLGGCEGESAACLEGRDVLTRWIGRTPGGNLYLVWRDRCAESSDCRAWMVEKSADRVHALLGLSGAYEFARGAGAYPSVSVRTSVNEFQNHHVRYEWRGARYVRTDSRVVYRVDGAECGTAEECSTAAQDAMRQQNVDRAVKIWERVHGVSWI